MSRKSLGEKEQEYLDALRVRLILKHPLHRSSFHDLIASLAACERLAVVGSLLHFSAELPWRRLEVHLRPRHARCHNAAGFAPQAFYYDGKPTMSDEEFENLEQELLWGGSRVAVLRCAVRPSECHISLHFS